MESSGPLEEIIERCVQRLASGETLDAVLRSYPEQAAELRGVLAPAQTIMTAPMAPVRPAASSLALNRMLSEVRSAAAQPREHNFLLAWFGSLKARPLAYQAVALAGAVVLFGGVGIGAAAATGSTPRPVEKILRISSDAQRKVTLKGTIISIEGDTLTLRPATGAAMDVRTVIVTASTKISRQGQRIAPGELRGGDVVEIEATLQDGRIEATAIRANGEPAPAAATTPGGATADATSAAQVPASGTPGGDDRGNQPGGPSHGGGSDDHRTPAADSTPEPGDDHGGASGGDDGTPAPGATPTASREDDDGTPSATEQPEPTHQPEPTEKPESTHEAEPTQKPESTQQPEATEQPEPTSTN